REPLDARHRGDRYAQVRAVHDEQRPDQVVGGEHVLAHHAPRPFGLAVAPHAGGEFERRALRWCFERAQARFNRTAVFDRHIVLRMASFYSLRLGSTSAQATRSMAISASRLSLSRKIDATASTLPPRR